MDTGEAATSAALAADTARVGRMVEDVQCRFHTDLTRALCDDVSLELAGRVVEQVHAFATDAHESLIGHGGDVAYYEYVSERACEVADLVAGAAQEARGQAPTVRA